jgi:nucleoside-diphosphate-sugar epimerase
MVVALCRHGADTRFLEQHGCALVEGDVRDESKSLAEGMAGCSHVVHSAALVYAEGAWPKVRAVNVDGTRNVLSAAVASGAIHATHISSVAVYGTDRAGTHESYSADSDLPPGDLYARSKREAEAVSRGIEEKRGLPITIVRPSAVYGERDRLLIPALLGVLRRRWVPRLGPAHNTLPVVYAGNAASAIVLAVEASRGHEAFDLGLDYPLTQRELLEGLATGAGLRPRFIDVPAGLVRGTAWLLSRMGVTIPGAKHVPLNRVVRLALGDNPYPSTRVREELGWNPPYQHSEALVRSAEGA